MKIAIVKLSALGDIIHAMVVLQFIKKNNPEIEIDWVVEERYRGLLQFNPDINKIHVVNIKNSKKKKSLYLFINELRKVRQFGSYDLVIDLQGLFKSAIISRLIRSSVTVGFEKFSARESFASIFYNQKFRIRYDENVIERNFELIKFALKLPFHKKEIENKKSFLFSNQRYLNSNLSVDKKNILLIPGASHPSKCYPVSNFVEFTTLLDANFLIIWGSQKEKKIADEIKTKGSRVSLCEKLSIDSLILLISQVDLVIGPDTGPTHIAWALNIPSITIFGPTPGYRNTYTTKVNQIIESDSVVDPNKINKNDDSIKNIKVSDIVEISKKLLT